MEIDARPMPTTIEELKNLVRTLVKEELVAEAKKKNNILTDEDMEKYRRFSGAFSAKER